MVATGVVQTVLVLVVAAAAGLSAGTGGIAFGVRVPPEHEGDELIARWRRAYRAGVAATAVVCAVAAAALTAVGLAVWASGAVAVMVLATVVLFGLARRAVLAAKRHEQWYAGVRPGAAVDTELRTRPEPYPWPWTAPALLVIAATAVLGAVRYPGLPDRIATHFDAAGTPDRTAPTTLLSAFAPVLIQVGLTAVLFGCAVLVLRGPAGVDPADPERSAAQRRSATGLASRAVLFLAAFVDLALFFVAAQVWRGGELSGGAAAAAAVSFAAGVLGLIGTVWYANRPASPTARRAGPAPVVHRDDDAHWRGGVIYVNPDDPALLVPRRNGLGLTVNFGHPWGWVVLAVLLAIPVISAVVGVLLS
jgi:uncharacterized membrane protein